jgi:hypothetical protein
MGDSIHEVDRIVLAFVFLEFLVILTARFLGRGVGLAGDELGLLVTLMLCCCCDPDADPDALLMLCELRKLKPLALRIRDLSMRLT